ncbi:hypothetical protein EYV94_27785 [Puteibacter caeruleilacunae]|nr:hypothetical protein EYV94_27785 [Puteibacter caeruleilacunae]
MSNIYIKYTPKEILQILNDFYLLQSEYIGEAKRGHKLSFETTIKNWRTTCNLLEPDKLTKADHEYFGLTTDMAELMDILSNENKNTLKEYCEYIAQNAKRETITLRGSLGGKCLEAGILKKINENLKKRGAKIKELKPSDNFPLLFKKHPEIFEVVSKLAPGTIGYYKIKVNTVSKIGGYLFLLAILILIIVLIVHKASWFLAIPFIVSFIFMSIGNKMKDALFDIGGYKTVRDLVYGIKQRV